MMGRVTNYSKEYLLFKSMVYVEEYGMKSITARELAEFCGCSTYPIYTHFKSISGLKEKILEEITVYFENYLAECSSDDVLSIVYLLKDFFSIHESIREIIAKSDLDMDSLFKRPFFSYVKGHTKIKEEKSLELVWLNALGSLRSDDSSQDFLEMMNAVWDKNEVTDEYLENILRNSHLRQQHEKVDQPPLFFVKKIVKCLTKHWNEGGSDNVTTAIYQKISSSFRRRSIRFFFCA